jgi:transposase
MESRMRMRRDRDRRSKYPPEYKRRMVDLVRAGRTVPSLAAEYGVSYSAISKWVKDADRGLSSAAPRDESEVQRLRRRVAELEEEREILKKASAWFAQEASRTSSRRSGS